MHRIAKSLIFLQVQIFYNFSVFLLIIIISIIIIYIPFSLSWGPKAACRIIFLSSTLSSE